MCNPKEIEVSVITPYNNMSNVRDTTNFTTIYLQTDMTLMWQYTTSAIKTPK